MVLPFAFMAEREGFRTHVCANGRLDLFGQPAQTLHVAPRGVAYAGFESWIYNDKKEIPPDMYMSEAFLAQWLR